MFCRIPWMLLILQQALPWSPPCTNHILPHLTELSVAQKISFAFLSEPEKLDQQRRLDPSKRLEKLNQIWISTDLKRLFVGLQGLRISTGIRRSQLESELFKTLSFFIFISCWYNQENIVFLIADFLKQTKTNKLSS